MDRDLELRINGHLYEIQAVNDEVLESRQGYPSAERGYRRTLESVAEVADKERLDEMATYVKEHIRENGKRPTNKEVRIEARSRISKAGYAPDKYLNAV